MATRSYRYTFGPVVSMQEVEETLMLAALAAEGIHGRSRIMLDAAFRLDPAARTCVVDAGTPAGESIATVFTEFLSREIGEGAFRVERSDAPVRGRSEAA